jgi:asparagine synthase (glutamine-hydrolysing)
MASFRATHFFEIQHLHTDEDFVKLDGVLHNRTELLSQLGLSHDLSDCDCIRACYRKCGTDAFNRLHGEFVFALWDAARQRLYCVRDAIGLRPLFYHHTRERLICATSIQLLFDAPLTPRRLARSAVANYLSGTPSPPDSTFFEWVHRLPSGHWLEADRDGSVQIRQFWNPIEIHPIEGKSAEWHASEFQDRLLLAIRARLPHTSSKVAVHVSGGLDSATVTAAIHQLDREWKLGLEIHAFTNVANHPAADERRYVKAVLGRYPMTAVQTVSERYWGFQESTIAGAIQDEPYCSPYLSRLVAELEIARDIGIPVILSGSGGDEIGGSSWYLLDMLLRGKFARFFPEFKARAAGSGRSIYALSRILLSGMRKWLRRERHRPAPPPPWVRPELVALRRFAPQPRISQGPHREDIYHRLEFCWTQPQLSTGHRIYDNLGVELRHPFLDRRLFEWVLSVPPYLFGENGHVKAPMRRAMADLLPEEILHRADKGNYLYYWDLGVRFKERERILRLLDKPISEEMGFIDARRLRKAYERYCGGGRINRQHLWAAITLESWLRRRAGQPG